MADLKELIAVYQQKLERKDELEEATKENNKTIEELKAQIADQMIEDDCSSIGLGDYTYSLQNKVVYSKLSEEKLAAAGLSFLDVLREQGLGDIIVERVDPRTLSSTCKQIVEEQVDLPDELKDVITTFETFDIARRKAKSTALKKAKEA